MQPRIKTKVSCDISVNVSSMEVSMISKRHRELLKELQTHAPKNRKNVMLSLDSEIIERAKTFCKARDIMLSRLVARLLSEFLDDVEQSEKPKD